MVTMLQWVKLRASVVVPTIGTRVDAGNSGIINTELPVGKKSSHISISQVLIKI